MSASAGTPAPLGGHTPAYRVATPATATGAARAAGGRAVRRAGPGRRGGAVCLRRAADHSDPRAGRHGPRSDGRHRAGAHVRADDRPRGHGVLAGSRVAGDRTDRRERHRPRAPIDLAPPREDRARRRPLHDRRSAERERRPRQRRGLRAHRAQPGRHRRARARQAALRRPVRDASCSSRRRSGCGLPPGSPPAPRSAWSLLAVGGVGCASGTRVEAPPAAVVAAAPEPRRRAAAAARARGGRAAARRPAPAAVTPAAIFAEAKQAAGAEDWEKARAALD